MGIAIAPAHGSFETKRFTFWDVQRDGVAVDVHLMQTTGGWSIFGDATRAGLTPEGQAELASIRDRLQAGYLVRGHEPYGVCSLCCSPLVARAKSAGPDGRVRCDRCGGALSE
ncbi:MAG TPA: hypothetical protein VHS09_06455 [Polyangiaceae bacterium]|jgi:hypothetical protein|nr:hypothetical protein [Polyangiaceae bacterium]